MLLPYPVGHDLTGEFGLLFCPGLLHEEKRLLGAGEERDLVEVGVVGLNGIDTPARAPDTGQASDLRSEPLQWVVALVHFVLGLLGQGGAGREQSGGPAGKRCGLGRVLRFEPAEYEIPDHADNREKHES